MYFRSEDGLAALIQQRNMNRAASADNFFSALEAKYGGGKAQKKQTQVKRKQKKESDDEDDVDEEEKLPKRGKKGKAAKK